MSGHHCDLWNPRIMQNCQKWGWGWEGGLREGCRGAGRSHRYKVLHGTSTQHLQHIFHVTAGQPLLNLLCFFPSFPCCSISDKEKIKRGTNIYIFIKLIHSNKKKLLNINCVSNFCKKKKTVIVLRIPENAAVRLDHYHWDWGSRLGSKAEKDCQQKSTRQNQHCGYSPFISSTASWFCVSSENIEVVSVFEHKSQILPVIL